MASINKYQKNGKTAWKIQYYSPDNKKRTKQGCETKTEAEKWTAENTINIANNTWISNEKTMPD